KKDLKENAAPYFETLRNIEKRGNIAHISDDLGQLDFLLNLDGPDRKIFSYIEDSDMRAILQNSYITNKYSKVYFKSSISAVLNADVEMLVISSEKHLAEVIDILPQISVKTIVFLKDVSLVEKENIVTLDYQRVYQNTNI